MEQINVDIGPDGAVKIDAVGFSGSDCETATRFLEDALGVVDVRRHKPEYRQGRVVGRKRTLRQGGGA